MYRPLRQFLFPVLLLWISTLCGSAAPTEQKRQLNRRSRSRGSNITATLTLPATLVEGETPTNNVTLLLSKAPRKPMQFLLSADPNSEITFPWSVIVPAKQRQVVFTVQAVDDNKFDGDIPVTLTAFSNGQPAIGLTTTVDNEKLILSLILPVTVHKGSAGTGTVTIPGTLSTPLTVTLSSADATALTVPPSVTIPAGWTFATFPVNALNNDSIVGNVTVTVTATALGSLPGAAPVSVLDPEPRTLELFLPTSIKEGGVTVVTVRASRTVTAPLVVHLSGVEGTGVTIPSAITILPGSNSLSFSLTVDDNNVVDGARLVTITAAADNFSSASKSMTITDDDGVLFLFPQGPVGEGQSIVGFVAVSGPVAAPLTVRLLSEDEQALTVPSTVTIPVGSNFAQFTINAVDDQIAQANQTVTITANADGFLQKSQQVTIVDNEKRLFLIFPSVIQEGATATGTVSLSGTLPTDLTVNLMTTNDADLAVPSTVTIPAGAISATFSMTAVDNGVLDGGRNVIVTASGDSVFGRTGILSIRDNDIAGYRFGPLPDIVNVTDPVAITVTAVDVGGNAIGDFSGDVNLDLVLPDGTVQQLSPATVTVSGPAGWTGSVSLPFVSATPLHFRVTDRNGHACDSNPFDPMRVVRFKAGDVVWDVSRGRFYASVSAASDTFGNEAVTIDPASLQITTMAVNLQDPGLLALTSRAETLYVGENGNGTVAKIDLASVRITSTFAVGTDQFGGGPLLVDDICAVPGHPNTVVISRRVQNGNPGHYGVAVYDNGVKRQNETRGQPANDRIEASADPTIFFGFGSETTLPGINKLKLDATGISVLDPTVRNLAGTSGADIRSSGNIVYSTEGDVIDGAQMRRLGSFSITGLVSPDPVSNRVYFLEPDPVNATTYNRISAYDPATFSLVDGLSLPGVVNPQSFFRWGSNGFAFRTADFVALINTNRLIPSGPPADLRVNLSATPTPASLTAPVTYTAQVVNAGPNLARNVQLRVIFSDNQKIQSAQASSQSAAFMPNVVGLPIGDLVAGASVTLTITTSAQSAGILSAVAKATSTTVDPDLTNNSASSYVSVNFQSATDTIYQLALGANNLIWDPTRELFWATIPAAAHPSGGTLISINPTSGVISEPVRLNGDPKAQCTALSGNGRYLYIGLRDSPEVHRVDLMIAPFSSTRIALGVNQWGNAAYPEDIEVLDGAGTSFLVATLNDSAAVVFDGTVPRPNRTGIYTVDRLERTSTPGLFLGYDNTVSDYKFTNLSISSSGVAITRMLTYIVADASDIRAAGNLVLSSTGLIFDASSLNLKVNLGLTGAPCLDPQKGHAYLIADDDALHGFDLSTGIELGSFALPAGSGAPAQNCLRWGADGFGFLCNGTIYLVRWSGL